MKNSKFMHQDMYPAVLFFAFSFYKNVVHHCHVDKRTFSSFVLQYRVRLSLILLATF